jgi:hypothetical protein
MPSLAPLAENQLEELIDFPRNFLLNDFCRFFSWAVR